MTGSMPEIIVAVLTLLGGVVGVALSRWWDRRKFRLLWIALPPDSMMKIHGDVAEKLKVSYGEDEVTNLTKRSFLLRNIGYKAINKEEHPLQWQAPGPVLDCGTPEAGSLLTVTVNSEDKHKIDIQWKEDYLNPGAREHVEVLYDARKEDYSLRLLGSRRETIISNKSASPVYELQHTTRKQFLAATFVGVFFAGLASVFLLMSDLYRVTSPLSLVTFVVVYLGVVSSFAIARARIEYKEKRQAEDIEPSRLGFWDHRKAAVPVLVLTVIAVVFAMQFLLRLERLEDQSWRIAELEYRARVSRVQSGTIQINSDDGIGDNSRGCPEGEGAWRGHVDRRLDFPEPFTSVPEVMAAISAVDHHVDNNLRLVLSVNSIDTKGFNYHFFTWCNTRLVRADMRWMAVAK